MDPVKQKPFSIQSIDLTCRIVDVDIEDQPYQLEFTIEGEEVLITEESIARVNTTHKKWWLANELEKLIRSNPLFRCCSTRY